MNEVTTNEFDFEEKSNRLAWVVPSVLLHVVVVAIWVLSPNNEPRNREERKLVIKSEQAQLLKQHVEDANLLELHAELSELQQIKVAMLKIREQKLAELTTFEDELHAQLPDDIREAVQAITKAQDAVIAKQKMAQVAVKDYEKAVAATSALALVDKLAALQQPMTQLKARRQAMNAALEGYQLGLEHVGQLVVRAQTLVEWVKDETVLATWQDFEAKHKHAVELSSAKIGELRRKLSEHSKAVDEMAGQARNHAEFLVKLKERETKAAQDYAKRKQDGEARIAECAKKIASLKARLASYAVDEPKLKAAYDQLKQEVDRMPATTRDERTAKNKKTSVLRRRKSAWEKIKRDRERRQGDLKRAERDKANREALLARLNQWHRSNGDKSRIERINAFLATLRQPIAGTNELIGEAVAAHVEAKKAAANAWARLAELIARQNSGESIR